VQLSTWRIRETDEDFHKLIRSLAVVNDDVTLFVSHIYETGPRIIYTSPLLLSCSQPCEYLGERCAIISREIFPLSSLVPTGIDSNSI